MTTVTCAEDGLAVFAPDTATEMESPTATVFRAVGVATSTSPTALPAFVIVTAPSVTATPLMFVVSTASPVASAWFSHVYTLTIVPA